MREGVCTHPDEYGCASSHFVVASLKAQRTYPVDAGMTPRAVSSIRATDVSSPVEPSSPGTLEEYYQ